MVSLNIYKNSANKFGRKTGFKIENEIEDQDQSIPKLVGISTQVFCTFGPNLVILAWTGDELLCRQAQNGVTFDFEVKFDLDGQGQSPPKTIGTLSKVFYTYGPNLVILAWTGDELSCRQASDYRTQWRTDGRTHRQPQATTIPEGQNWPRVKINEMLIFSIKCMTIRLWLWITILEPASYIQLFICDDVEILIEEALTWIQNFPLQGLFIPGYYLCIHYKLCHSTWVIVLCVTRADIAQAQLVWGKSFTGCFYMHIFRNIDKLQQIQKLKTHSIQI